MQIRSAEPGDSGSIREIHLNAFDENERHAVADLAAALLSEPSDPGALHLVAEDGGTIVGHVCFSPLFDRAKLECVGFLLAPLAVASSFQKRGIGSALVREGLRRLEERHVDSVLVYGDPAYYGRFDFEVETAKRFVLPFPLSQPDGWQVRLRDPGGFLDEVVRLDCVEPLRSPELW